MGLIEERLTPDFAAGNKKVWRYTPLLCVIKIGDQWYKGMKVAGQYVVELPIKESMAEKMLDNPFEVSDPQPGADQFTNRPRLYTDEERVSNSAGRGRGL